MDTTFHDPSSSGSNVRQVTGVNRPPPSGCGSSKKPRTDRINMSIISENAFNSRIQ